MFCTIRRPMVCGLPAGSVLNLNAIEKAPRERGLGIVSAVCAGLMYLKLVCRSLRRFLGLLWLRRRGLL